jgi:putative transposase
VVGASLTQSAQLLEYRTLNANWFLSLADARRKIGAWRKDYNEQRPHSSLGYLPPCQFAQAAMEMRA